MCWGGGLCFFPTVIGGAREAYGFRMRLGLFDPNATDANRAIGAENIGSDEHKLT